MTGRFGDLRKWRERDTPPDTEDTSPATITEETPEPSPSVDAAPAEPSPRVEEAGAGAPAAPTPTGARPDSASATPRRRERRMREESTGILGRVPMSVRDEFDRHLLDARPYVGRTNMNLAVHALVALVIENPEFRECWVDKMIELREQEG